MNSSYYGMLVRDPFSEIPKTPSRSKSLYFKDEAWMKYHKCPLCGNYVLKEPELIKVPRGSAKSRSSVYWNSALLYITNAYRCKPCLKCTGSYSSVFYTWCYSMP